MATLLSPLRCVGLWPVLQFSGGDVIKPRGLAFRNRIAPVMHRLPGTTESTSDGGVVAVEELQDVAGSHGDEVQQSTAAAVKGPVLGADYNSTHDPAEQGDEPVRIGELIAQRRKERGLTQAQLGALVGISKQGISEIEHGRTRSLRAPTLTGLHKALGIPLHVLQGRRVANVDDLTENPAELGSFGPKARRLRVVGTVSIGPLGAWSDVEPGEPGSYLDFPSDDPAAYALRIVGDSLHPRVKSGEYVVLEPGHEVAPGDEVLLVLRDGRNFLRELAYRRGGQVALNGLNNGVGRMTVDEDDVAEIHYVSAIAKHDRYRSG